jgi:hypothetical protein
MSFHRRKLLNTKPAKLCWHCFKQPVMVKLLQISPIDLGTPQLGN